MRTATDQYGSSNAGDVASATDLNTPAGPHCAVVKKPDGVNVAFEPTEKWIAALALAFPEDRPTAKRTRVKLPHGVGASVSSTRVAVNCSAPPRVVGAFSTDVGMLVKKRYFFATAYSRYCASAAVGHGKPYAPSVAPQAEAV